MSLNSPPPPQKKVGQSLGFWIKILSKDQQIYKPEELKFQILDFHSTLREWENKPGDKKKYSREYCIPENALFHWNLRFSFPPKGVGKLYFHEIGIIFLSKKTKIPIITITFITINLACIVIIITIFLLSI